VELNQNIFTPLCSGNKIRGWFCLARAKQYDDIQHQGHLVIAPATVGHKKTLEVIKGREENTTEFYKKLI